MCDYARVINLCIIIIIIIIIIYCSSEKYDEVAQVSSPMKLIFWQVHQRFLTLHFVWQMQ